MALTIISIGLLYFISHLLTRFFVKTRIPDVLILILIGIMAGPVFHWLSVDSFGQMGHVITSIALIIILFEGGLNLEINTIKSSMRLTSILTFSFFIVTAALVAFILHFGYKYPWMISFITGFILGGTSSAVVFPMVNALKIDSRPSTILILESALTDVLCIVFVISFLNGYKSGEVEPGKIFGTLISSLILASVIGISSGYFWIQVLNWIRTFPNTQFTTFAFMFVVYGIAEFFGFSGAIASLAFGIYLGNYNLITLPFVKIGKKIPAGIITDSERSLYSEIVFLLKIYFFVYLGVSIPFNERNTIFIAILLVAFIYFFRIIITRLLIKETYPWFDKAIISVMVPKGLAAAVLAGLPLQYGIPEGHQIQNIVYNVVFFSILITSVLIPIIQFTFIGYFFKWLFAPKQHSD
jgi:NhaP-type Na+/H+ or K+/H+ antiporter